MNKIALLAATCVMTGGIWLAAQHSDAQLGGPLAGISPRDFELFRLGREDFVEVETAEDGLGPTFNGTSCAQCHNIPVIGGAGTMVEARAGRREEDGAFHAPPGGTLVHLFSIPPHDCQVAVAAVYEEANVVAHRISIPLFGAGLVEAIPDETLLALQDPEDLNADGVRGRAAMVEDIASGEMRVGRFGWKSQHATLLVFGADAYRDEMGITNDLFRDESSAEGNPGKLRLCDPTSDPEDVREPRTGLRGIDNFANFLRFLAPPPRGAITPEVERGEHVFREVGCASCHVPALTTGPSSEPPFDRRQVPLFSDLLLHNVGTGDGIVQSAATGDEIRTPALWGLRFRRPLLHDGSASTIEAAIRRHDVEAAGARARFQSLSDEQRRELLAFLRSL